METLDLLLSTKVGGIKLLDADDFFDLVFRFLFNTLITIIIVRYIYYPITKRKDYLFTYLMLSVVIFLLSNLLNNVKLELGFALGLFAIFGIIRYRTNTIPIKEMTYLFVIIGLAVINALANKKVSYAELLFTNLAVVAIIYGLEKMWLLVHESSKSMVYENIELIKEENHELLMEDLKKRTGLNIHRFEIGRMDFLRDTARIKVFYYESSKYAGTEIAEGQFNSDDDD